MKRAKLLLIVAAFVGLLQGQTVTAQYGGGNYGSCAYGNACVITQPPVAERPPVVVPPGETVVDEEPATNIVVSDIDKDGNQEEAIDTDNNPNNGYEEYNDPDGSSELLVTIQNPNGPSFIIDTDGDSQPDVYWDPGTTYSAPVVVQRDTQGIGWYYQDKDGRSRVYYAERFSEEENEDDEAAVTGSSNPQQGERQFTNEAFGGEVYESIGEIAAKVPPGVAYSFPYLLLAIIGLIILRLVMQTKQELSRVAVVVDKIRKENELVEEKQNFLMLSSHYMRTPMTVLKGNIELLQSIKQLDDASAQLLQSIASSLQTKIEALLSRLNEDKGLAMIQAPVQRESVATRKIILSPQVLLPITTVVVVSVLAQFIFIDFRVTRPNVIDALVQIGLAILLVQIFVSKVRGHRIQRQNRQDQNEVLEKQRELDRARAELVNAAATDLRGDVVKLEGELTRLTSQGTDISRIRKGSDQLKTIIDKFVFAAGLQAGQVTAQKELFSSNEVIQNSISALTPTAQDKKVALSATGDEQKLIQNKQLMSIVVGSLVDNAVKFAQENSNVSITTQSSNNALTVTIDNQGKEIDQSKIDQLFKPFSRLESVETFDQEGLGFSLYLDRLIMLYLGGQIGIEPVPNHGTKAFVSVPIST